MIPITIIGGGLAGLTLGILLRKENVPVTVVEAGTYPRHRVCGEFISGAGLKVIDDLFGLEALLKAGAVKADRAAFFNGRRRCGENRLPSSALCISRFILDEFLANELVRLGGELKPHSRWTDSVIGEGVVVAAGRRAAVDHHEARWFGLKAHARNVSLQADLEMHCLPNGYVGMCRLADGIVNVCGLFRRGPAHDKPRLPEQLRGLPGSSLFARMQQAEFVSGSECAVAALAIGWQNHRTDAVCIGDSLSMIPPVAGNGMSMAFESAQIASGYLCCYARGEMDWKRAGFEMKRCSHRAFRQRFRWAHLVHCTLLHPLGRSLVLPVALHWNSLWNQLFMVTRRPPFPANAV